MKIAYLIKKTRLLGNAAVVSFLKELKEAGADVYNVSQGMEPDTALLLSFGGDGTFLSAASQACEAGVPILGVNLGRLGFLSENDITDLVEPLLAGDFTIENRSMIEVEVPGGRPEKFFPYALNEMTLRRTGTGTLGLSVQVDGEQLPTYWADGVLVSTPSGSTAYSLSVGGPVVRPDVGALILAPIAPHNLNLRPLILPPSSEISICGQDRKGAALSLSLDNRDYLLPDGESVIVRQAPFTLKRVVMGKSNFIEALQTKLLWGEDVRNTH